MLVNYGDKKLIFYGPAHLSHSFQSINSSEEQNTGVTDKVKSRHTVIEHGCFTPCIKIDHNLKHLEPCGFNQYECQTFGEAIVRNLRFPV